MHGIRMGDMPTNRKGTLPRYWMFKALLTKKPSYIHQPLESQVDKISKKLYRLYNSIYKNYFIKTIL